MDIFFKTMNSLILFFLMTSVIVSNGAEVCSVHTDGELYHTLYTWLFSHKKAPVRCFFLQLLCNLKLIGLPMIHETAGSWLNQSARLLKIPLWIFDT